MRDVCMLDDESQSVSDDVGGSPKRSDCVALEHGVSDGRFVSPHQCVVFPLDEGGCCNEMGK
jgi:hypothetical protein